MPLVNVPAGILAASLALPAQRQALTELIQENFYRPVDAAELKGDTLQAMVESLGDPHTQFLSPDEASALNETMNRDYSGVGVVLRPGSAPMKVLATLPGSPAREIGLKPGDLITAVDGKTVGSDWLSSEDRIRGPTGSPVTLTVLRDEQEFSLTLLRRDVIQANSFSRMLPDRIGYLRIASFPDRLPREEYDHLAKLSDEGMQSLVIDLRFNQGGDSTAAGIIASFFLKNGQKIYSLHYKNKSPYVARVKNGEDLPELPLAVLVNHHTMSSSEMFAAALQDHRRAVIIGQRTWGKGLGQVLLPFGDMTLKITTALWKTPLGRSIQSLGPGQPGGVVPDVEFPTDARTEIAILRQLHLEIHGADPGAQRVRDPWLDRAIALLRPNAKD